VLNDGPEVVEVAVAHEHEGLIDRRPRAAAEIQHEAQARDLDRGLDPGGTEAEQGYAAHAEILPRSRMSTGRDDHVPSHRDTILSLTAAPPA